MQTTINSQLSVLLESIFVIRKGQFRVPIQSESAKMKIKSDILSVNCKEFVLKYLRNSKKFVS